MVEEIARKLLGNPMDDFFNQHGGNIPDPLAAYGKGRSGFSPADDDQNQNDQTQDGQTQNDQTQDDQGRDSATVGEITLHTMICGSDIIGKENIGKGGDDCIIVEYGNNDNFDVDMANDFVRDWYPKGTNGQQYEGEGGYTGGGGRSANDLYIGSIGRMTGKVVGGRDPGEAGLGKDTGHKTPAICEAIAKYVSLGGKVRGKAGYQSGDSGLGQDVGGAAEKRISGLKKARDAQRFVIDPNAPNPEAVPWWLQEKVSPTAQASTVQVNAVQAGLEQGVAAQQKKAAK